MVSFVILSFGHFKDTYIHIYICMYVIVDLVRLDYEYT